MGSKHSLKYCGQFAASRRQWISSVLSTGVTFSLGAGAFSRGRPEPTRSLIIVYLTGGLAHQDSFDPKPKAPAEIRGEFGSIPTKLPGIRFTEHLPLLAARADRFSLVRSLVGLVDEHSSFQNLTGFPMAIAQREGIPHVGSIVAKALGPSSPTMPPFVDLFPVMQHRPYNSPGPGALGRAALGARLDTTDIGPMKLPKEGRDALMSRLSLVQRVNANGSDVGREFDGPYLRAVDLLATQSLTKTLDLEAEGERVRDRYGRGSTKHQGDGAPLWNDQLILARRLVEAGARVVTVAYGFWDTHGNNFNHLKGNLPLLDRGISALLDDLADRGLLDTTTLMVCSEFGRTPKVNKDAGRDHWARVNGCLLAGGAIKPGMVVGATDNSAAEAHDDPIHHRDVLATVLASMGIDLASPISDVAGRPMPPLPGTARPVEKLLGPIASV